MHDTMTRLLLADDHDLVRETIAQYLEHQGKFDVVRADTLDAALAVCESRGPFDLVLLDYAMPGMDSLRGLARMQERVACPVAVISGTTTSEIAARVHAAGAAGFLPKTLDPASLLRAVRRMLVGQSYMPDAELLGPGPAGEGVTLTPRESDVLRGLAEGKSNKEIARDLDIREVTVKLHVKTLSRKLGARNRTHAAMLARDIGLA